MCLLYYVPRSGKRVHIRKPAMALSDVAPLRRFSRPVLISSNMKKNTAAPRPIRERLVHLLALKPYRKSELLVRLTKDGLSPQDKDTLDSLLQQVMAALQTLFLLKRVCVCLELSQAAWVAQM